MLNTKEKVIVFWAIFSITAILSQALIRIFPTAIQPWAEGMMSTPQKLAYILWVIINAYTEGVRGFQQRFCPKVVSRAFHLAKHPRPAHILFAAPYCMGLFHAERKTLISTWIFLSVLIVVIIAVRSLPQPWRGIIDGGVIVGLFWGIVAMWIQLFKALQAQKIPLPIGISFEDSKDHSIISK